MRRRIRSNRFWNALTVDLLFLVSLVSLCLGICAPILEVSKTIWFIELSENSFSLYGGIIGLFQNGQYGVGVVLLSFTIVFPFMKLFLLSLVWWREVGPRSSRAIFFFLRHIGHFSMLDVFVVAVVVVIVRMNALAEAKALWGLYVFTLHVISSISLTIFLEWLRRGGGSFDS